MSLKYLVQKSDNPIIQDKADNIAIGKLSMNCFRSYDHQNLNVQGANVLLTGHNGSGKSNILEAITTPLPGKILDHQVCKIFINVGVPVLVLQI